MKTQQLKNWAISKDKTGFYIDSDSGMICTMNSEQPANIENAKLISAAPDLLNACSELLQLIEIEGEPFYNKHIEKFNNAIDAIKKAT